MKEKLKKKKGIARLFEIAGERKGLLILAGILSAGSATCMLVPYWSVYRVLQELLLHASDLEKIDSGILIYWGWFAFFGLIGGLLLLYAALMASPEQAEYILYSNFSVSNMSRPLHNGHCPKPYCLQILHAEVFR